MARTSPTERRARTGWGLRVAVLAVFAFLHIPLLLVVLYAFDDEASTLTFPPPGFTTKWFHEAWNDDEVRTALWLSLRAGLLATAVALVLGSLAAFGLARSRFFGRDSISFLFVLPIALPGIITGMALSATFAALGIPLGYFAIVIGHATFCIVLVYNNAIARLRRTSRSFEEASADLAADSFQTFRYVTFPAIRTSLLAGALLAFALSFDEVIVTIFMAGGVKTLPIWIFQSFRLANQVPVVNVAGVVAILLSAIPVYVASRISADTSTITGARG